MRTFVKTISSTIISVLLSALLYTGTVTAKEQKYVVDGMVLINYCKFHGIAEEVARLARKDGKAKGLDLFNSHSLAGNCQTSFVREDKLKGRKILSEYFTDDGWRVRVERILVMDPFFNSNGAIYAIWYIEPPDSQQEV